MSGKMMTNKMKKRSAYLQMVNFKRNQMMMSKKMRRKKIKIGTNKLRKKLKKLKSKLFTQKNKDNKKKKLSNRSTKRFKKLTKLKKNKIKQNKNKPMCQVLSNLQNQDLILKQTHNPHPNSKMTKQSRNKNTKNNSKQNNSKSKQKLNKSRSKSRKLKLQNQKLKRKREKFSKLKALKTTLQFSSKMISKFGPYQLSEVFVNNISNRKIASLIYQVSFLKNTTFAPLFQSKNLLKD